MSEERSNDNDNNSITSTPNEKIREPIVENDNVPPDRTTGNAPVSRDDTVRQESEKDERNPMCVLDKTPQVYHDNGQSKYENERTDKDNNASSRKTAGEKLDDKCENEEGNNKSTGEPNDKSMCVLDNEAPTGNETTRQQKVNDNSNDESGDALPLPPDLTNSTQTPQKSSEQQLVKDENNPVAKTPSPRNNKKTQSHAHQLRTNTGTKLRHHSPHLQHKHSLDENIHVNSDSDEYDEYAYSSFEDYTAPDGQSLPEFVGDNENAPEIFKAPRRAAVHPNRPSFLELRPHPLRETQVGKFLRTIASTDTQLWAGQECGVRVWKLSDAYAPGIGIGGRARRGDEEAAPFYESVTTSPTLCLAIDCGSNLVWSGHKDGKIRSWIMDVELNDDPFSDGLSWQAHRGPVLALVISSYGMSYSLP